MGNCIPHRHWRRWPGDVARGILLTECDARMIVCLEWQIYPSVIAQLGAKPHRRSHVHDQELMNGLGRLQLLCDLSFRDYKLKLGGQGKWRISSLASASSWHASKCEVRSLPGYSQRIMRGGGGHKCAGMWITRLAGGSSPEVSTASQKRPLSVASPLASYCVKIVP